MPTQNPEARKEAQMPRRSTSILTALFLPLVASVLLVLLLGAGLTLNFPNQAEEMFGPPVAGLSLGSRYRLALQLVLQKNDLTTPLDLTGMEIPFPVALGESVPSVIQRLVKDGLIGNPGAFRAYLQYTGLDVSLQAGDYRLSPAMSPVEIAQQMQDATPAVLTFTILAGWRIEEAAASLPSSGLEISPKAFISAALVRDTSLPLAGELPVHATLEGFLFPGAYEVPRQVSAPELIQRMVSRFEEQISSELRQAFASQGLSLFEAVTLASIIEREAIVDEEMPLIASVFYNRLAAGSTLSADPTVQFALGFNETQNTWWTNPLRGADLQVESLYNTYIYPGLPPGPIANPGLLALKAAAFPAQTPYVFFRAACDGSGHHSFAETYAEHLANACP